MPKKTTKNTESGKAPARGKRSTAKEKAPAASLDQIRDRAYRIFRSGANPSDPVADWLQAERELSGEAER